MGGKSSRASAPVSPTRRLSKRRISGWAATTAGGLTDSPDMADQLGRESVVTSADSSSLLPPRTIKRPTRRRTFAAGIGVSHDIMGSTDLEARRMSLATKQARYAEWLVEHMKSNSGLAVADLHRFLAQRNEGWDARPEIFNVLGSLLQRKGEFLVSADVLQEGLDVIRRILRRGDGGEDMQRLRMATQQALALSLAKAGSTLDAIRLLDEVMQDGLADDDTVGILARCYKDLSEAAGTASERLRHLKRALQLYRAAFEKGGRCSYYLGINAATMALLLGHRDSARLLAREVAKLCLDALAAPSAEAMAIDERYWVQATLGESEFILGNFNQAIKYYRAAAGLAGSNYALLSSTRRQIRLMYEQSALKDAEAPLREEAVRRGIVKLDSFVVDVASSLHEVWRSLRRREDGTYEPRIKVIDGKRYDIASLTFKELPTKFQRENWESAKVACREVIQAIHDGRELDDDFLLDGSRRVHAAWMARRGDVRDAGEEMSKADEEKGRKIVEAASAAARDQLELGDFEYNRELTFATMKATQDLSPQTMLSFLDAIFEIPRVVCFVSPLMRVQQRLPESLEEQMKELIAMQLSRWPLSFGYCSGSPVDIFFAEVMMDMGVQLYMVLPCPEKHFIDNFVSIYPGEGWVARFRACLNYAAQVHIANSVVARMTHVNYQYGTFILNGMAALRAKLLGTEVVRLVASRQIELAHIMDRTLSSAMAAAEGKEEEEEDGDSTAGDVDMPSEGTVTRNTDRHWFGRPWVVGYWRKQGLDYRSLHMPVMPALHSPLDSPAAAVPALPSLRESSSDLPDDHLAPIGDSSASPRRFSSVSTGGIGGSAGPDSLYGSVGRVSPQIIMNVLTTSLVNYEKLTEAQVLVYSTTFLANISRVLDGLGASSRPVATVNWAGTCHFVFARVEDAGRFALLFSDIVTSTDWTQLQLPSFLTVRLSLHSAPLFYVRDALTGRQSYTGVHIGPQAGVTAVCPPGSVYCSQAFAAMAETTAARAFRVRYVGSAHIGGHRKAGSHAVGLQPVVHLHRLAWATLQEQERSHGRHGAGRPSPLLAAGGPRHLPPLPGSASSSTSASGMPPSIVPSSLSSSSMKVGGSRPAAAAAPPLTRTASATRGALLPDRPRRRRRTGDFS
eukprot:PLAT1711.1.p1 GENE.PLAT1711.1~~PLAT1711.1.p1  ORF type:complete len:1154 (+),score=501.46 PLAT1711.1:63-3464(+)